MTIRVGINGFGRIGRMALRAIAQQFAGTFEVVAINGTLEPDYMAYMLKYDSIHGRFAADVQVQDGDLVVDGNTIRLSADRNPANLTWGEQDVDLVLECTGAFLTTEGSEQHLQVGAKKVMMSAPSKDATPMFVYGVNHQDYAGQAIVSAASCTTNCLAPVAQVLVQNWGIKRGLMSTVHAATASQKTVDGPSKKDWRGGRGILENIIPSSTGATKALGRVMPGLQGKLTGMSFRVPTSDVSVVDLTVELASSASYEAVCAAIQVASQSSDLHGVLEYTEDSVVSTDFRGHPAASIFDAKAGIALDDTFMKLVCWYDNEYGYACNMLRLAQHVMSA
ncbi:MAG: type I glyceraldehyde-3-phosphate dehydrogenase [Pseudomonadota bacterium]